MARSVRTLAEAKNRLQKLANESNIQLVRNFLATQKWMPTTIQLENEYLAAYKKLADVSLKYLAKDGKVDLGQGSLDLGLGADDPRAPSAIFSLGQAEGVMDSMGNTSGPGSYANFNAMNVFFKTLFPSLRENYQLGHQNISVLKVALAQHSQITAGLPDLDKAAALVLGVVTKIDQLNNSQDIKGTTLRELYSLTIDELNKDREFELELKREIKKIGKLDFVIEAKYEPIADNLRKGAKSGAVMRAFNRYLREERTILSKHLNSIIDPSVLKSSPDLITDLELFYAAKLKPKSALLNGKKAPPKTPKGKRRIETGILKGAGLKKAKIQQTIRRKPETKFSPVGPARGKRRPEVNATQLQALIQAKISGQMVLNMQAPALVNRTGRLAGSVTVGVRPPRKGPKQSRQHTISYNYQKFPYETFARGGAQFTPQRDVDKLIQRSIRAVATELVVGKFSTKFKIISGGPTS